MARDVVRTDRAVVTNSDRQGVDEGDASGLRLASLQEGTLRDESRGDEFDGTP